MQTFMKVGLLSNRIYRANPEKSMNALLSLLQEHTDCDLMVMPPLCLTGKAGKLLTNRSVIDASKKALSCFQEETKDLSTAFILGTIDENGTPCHLVYQRGILLGKFEDGSTDKQMLRMGNGKVCLYTKGIRRLLFDLGILEEEGIDVLLVSDYEKADTESLEKREESLKMASQLLGCRALYVGGGAGDTSSPELFEAVVSDFDLGTKKTSLQDFLHPTYLETVVDIDLIRGYKRNHGLSAGHWLIGCEAELPHRTVASLLVEADPYIAGDKNAFLERLFSLQAAALAARMRNIGVLKTVIGVSGGLDSTLALLVCKRAMEMLKLPPDHIIAVTMQGFGTSGKTYQNAQTLMKQLGCDLREIPITDAVLQHFRDIGHDATLHDTTYENAQARQRTQILLDLSNKEGAIVVGTGDLSEAALGFCTFAGDHMANFNVNVCVTKTMMRQMIGYLCETEAFLFCSAVLLDILNTPISPELLPADEEGNIAQKTEQILGPYELHDFFLYYVVQYGCSGDELRFYARQAFPQISGEEIDRAAGLFLKRFVQNQFKRSCAPDCANITTVNLTALQFSFPSDSDVCAFLEKNETF